MYSHKPQFEKLTATHLYCGTCRRSMPVREKLLLVTPDGDLYDYTCEGCGSSTGSRTERTPPGGASPEETY